MFKSNIREFMKKKEKTLRDISQETGISTQTVFRATQDATIGSCQLNTLAKIGEALGVKVKKLFEETDAPATEEPADGSGRN